MAETVRSRGALRHPLLQLLPLLRPHVWRGIEVLAYLLLAAASALVVPWAMQYLIDDVIPQRDARGLVLWVVLPAVVVLGGGLATYRRIVIAGAMAAQVLVELRQRCVEKYCSLPPRFLDRERSGDLLSRITNDVDHMHGVIERTLPALIFETTTLLVMSAYAVYLNGLLAFLALGIGAPIFSVMYLTTSRRLRASSRSLQDCMGDLSATASEHLANHAIIVSFGLRNWAENAVAAILGRMMQLSIRVARVEATLTAGTQLVFQGIRIAVLALGVLLIFRGEMTVGALVAFLTIVAGLIAPFVTIADYYGELAIAAGALERVQGFLRTEAQTRDGTEKFDGALGDIEVRGVSVAYSPGIDVLQCVSAVLPRNSFVALVGPSGSGKTSFLYVLTRFLDPDSGCVLVNGRDLKTFAADSWRHHLALVTQTPLLFNASIVENVRLGRLDASPQEIAAALRAAALDIGGELPHLAGDEPIGEGGALLSGGQRQRLTLARALVRNAPLLLLDEATSSLDPAKEMAVLDGLAAYRRQSGCTIVFSTHRAEAAARADIVFRFDGGRIERIK
ncbi:MAG: ABC transporter ATP-binding protein [Burkholderiales bacterium]|nr:ABC transporter ATP-binding protein [Burkholderiales bacterium]